MGSIAYLCNCCIQLVPQESSHFLYFRHNPYLPYLAAFLQPKLRYLGSDDGTTCLDKLRQIYMLAALNTMEAGSKQNIDKYDDIAQNKIEDLIMIKNFNKKLNWDTKYIPNFRIIRLIGTRQLEVSDPTGRLRR